MSLEENKAIVRRIYDELWNERKLEVADEVIAADGRYVNYDTGLVPVPADPEDMKQTVRAVTAGFPDNYHAVEEMIAEGDRVVARVTLTATHEGEFMGIAPTGRRIAITEIHIYRLEDGKVVEHRVGRDDLGAMRQLGVIPEESVPGPPRVEEPETRAGGMQENSNGDRRRFLVVAHDHTDDEALVRRLVVRERHLAAARRAVESGNMLIGGAILDEEGRMVGSMSVVSFPDRAVFDEWLQGMPYMKNNIWERVEVYPYHVSVAAWPDGEGPADHHELAPNSEPLPTREENA